MLGLSSPEEFTNWILCMFQFWIEAAKTQGAADPAGKEEALVPAERSHPHTHTHFHLPVTSSPLNPAWPWPLSSCVCVTERVWGRGGWVGGGRGGMELFIGWCSSFQTGINHSTGQAAWAHMGKLYLQSCVCALGECVLMHPGTRVHRQTHLGSICNNSADLFNDCVSACMLIS